MNPLVIIGSVVAGAMALTSKKSDASAAPEPPAAIKNQIVAAATEQAKIQMSRGTPPERAAAWGTERAVDDWQRRSGRMSGGVVRF